MIQRRAVVTLLAVTALAAGTACKKNSTADPAAPPIAGSGSGGSAVPTGSAGMVAGSGSDNGSAMPKPGGPITQPFFYKVEKDGKTSYLLGTWHVGVDAATQMPKAVWDAFATAKAFVMETNPAEQAGLDALARHDGKTLEQELGPEYWAKLEALVEPAMLAQLAKAKVFAAAVQLQYKDMPAVTPMDLAFLSRAETDKKQLVFLEPALTQIKLFEKWVDLRMLKATIDDYTETRTKIDTALGAYMVGDDAALVAMVLDREGMKEAGFTDAELDTAANELLYDRSASWIPTLEQLFAKGDAFVAVGAGHLIGPKSVVELLQGKGFTVTRVGAT